MDFSRPEYWSGSLFPSPEDLPNPGIEPRSPPLQADFYQLSHQGLFCFTYLFLAVLGLPCCLGFSLVATSGGYASLRQALASHCSGFSCCGAQTLGCFGFSSWGSGLQSTDSVVKVHGLRCPEACGISPGQGLNSCLLHRQAGSLPLSHQGSLKIDINTDQETFNLEIPCLKL